MFHTIIVKNKKLFGDSKSRNIKRKITTNVHNIYKTTIFKHDQRIFFPKRNMSLGVSMHDLLDRRDEKGKIPGPWGDPFKNPPRDATYTNTKSDDKPLEPGKIKKLVFPASPKSTIPTTIRGLSPGKINSERISYIILDIQSIYFWSSNYVIYIN